MDKTVVKSVTIHFEEDGRYVTMPMTVTIPAGLVGKAERMAIEDEVADIWGDFEAIDYVPAKEVTDGAPALSG
jgi:hypothetical protein